MQRNFGENKKNDQKDYGRRKENYTCLAKEESKGPLIREFPGNQCPSQQREGTTG
jgi:hypothetical protein